MLHIADALLRARELNTLAYSELLLSCNDDVAFGAVDEACPEDLPGGSATLAWANLVAKFEPRTPSLKVKI
jgi:hypothetical protein